MSLIHANQAPSEISQAAFFHTDLSEVPIMQTMIVLSFVPHVIKLNAVD